jgi:hypothetical protein
LYIKFENVAEVQRQWKREWNSRFHWRTSATFSNLIYHFKMEFRSSNVNRAPAIFFHYHTSYVTWSYSHASCWENTILHIVMIIQFNFENNTQIPSIKVCIHLFGGPCILESLSIVLNVTTKQTHYVP